MANTYRMQRTKKRFLALPSMIQSDAAVTLPDVAFVRAELMETGNFANVTPKKEDDYEYAGKGHSFATDSQIVEMDSGWEWGSRVNEWNVGWLLAMVMGVDTFTAGANGGPNTHVFTFADNTNPAPLTNIYISDTEAIQQKLLDMGLKTLVLTGSETGSIKFKATFVGTGRTVDGAIANAPALEVSPTYLRGSDAQWSIGPTGGPLVSYYPRVRSWELTLDSGMEAQRRSGAGEFAAFVANGDPTLKLKFSVDADSTEDIKTWSRSNTQLGAQIVIPIGNQTVASPWSLTLAIPCFVIPKDDPSEQASKYVGYTIELDEHSILKPANAPIISATLVNMAPQYLETYA